MKKIPLRMVLSDASTLKQKIFYNFDSLTLEEQRNIYIGIKNILKIINEHK
jgi:hypothetical protein